MSKNRSSRGGFADRLNDMTPMQKKAAIVLACCVLAVVVTTVAVCMIVSGAKGTPGDDPAASGSVVPNDFELDLDGNAAVLKETKDAGDEYLKQTVFVGDSNTVRMNKNGLITLDQYVGKEGLGIQSVASEKLVYFKGDETAYTIPEALAKMKPRRIVVMMGTNNADGSASVDEFIGNYKAALNAIKNAYAYTDIIVAAIPPVPYDHSSYPAITMQTIDSFNQALADMCQEEGYSFLNTSEVLKDQNGYGKDSMFNQGDIHMTSEGLNAILTYVRTHALDSKDRRPDTNNIPARAEMPVSATPAPSAEKKEFSAKYYVEQGTGGTLTSGDQSGQTSLSFDVSKEDSITVTAKPNDGFIFVKWSDGKKDAERTDKNFSSNLSVTAQFKAKPGISISESSLTMVEGENKSLTAKIQGGGKLSSVVWNVNGEKKGSGETFALNKLAARGEAYKIEASIVIDGKTYKAEATVKVEPKVKDPVSVSIEVSGSTTLPASGGVVKFTAKVDPADATTQFVWTAEGGTISANQGTAEVTFPANTGYEAKQYTVTVKTSNGKVSPAITVTVDGNPKPTEPPATPAPSTPPAESVAPSPEASAQPSPSASPDAEQEDPNSEPSDGPVA